MSTITMANKRFQLSRSKMALLGLAVVAVAGGFALKKYTPQSLEKLTRRPDLVTKESLARILSQSASFYHFPTEMEIPGIAPKVVLQYSFDPTLQDEMENLFRQYRPDYGAFVAMDATTGQILSVVSYSEKSDMKENMAFRATFPSASVFKVVTAAAAIENQKYSGDTPIQFNGANHTLYKHNILKNKINRWTRQATLKDAFAKSINTVFGRIGAFTVGPVELRTYADRFGFNRQIQADFLFQQGKAPIPDDAWGIAEAASGYTRENTMSPMQGALIAATIVNEGVMMEPYLVQSVYSPEGQEIYSAKPKVAQLSIEPSTAAELRRLMRETVIRGTSRKSFRGFERSKFSDINVGGKTGSLTGTDPQGKYDWFVAFAEGRGRRIAFASLTIHQKLWRVKSSYVVRKAIETYFKKPMAAPVVAPASVSSAAGAAATSVQN
jgi:cell division protein FtsI/penicillin-binding protein 2